MQRLIRFNMFFSLLIGLFALSACTIQLTPDYDAALVEGLDEANTEALTLFAALDDDPPNAEFEDYADDYSQLIGRFDALRQRAMTRPTPPLAKRLSAVPVVADFCNSEDDPYGCVNASPSSLSEVISLLRTMRRTHRTRGLTDDLIQNFRNGYDVAIGQALTVENALQR